MFGQNKEIQDAQRKKKVVQQQLTLSKKTLETTQKNLRLKLRDISMLTNQVENRQRYIDSVMLQLEQMEIQVDSLERVVEQTGCELKIKKADYARSLRFVRIHKTVESPLLFILSTETVSQMYRRARYAREYANYQRVLVEQIQRKQLELIVRKNELLDAKAEKNRLMLECMQQKKLLEQQQEQETRKAAALKQHQQSIMKDVEEQQRKLLELDRQIDEWVSFEIEQTRLREEAERRQKQVTELKISNADKGKADAPQIEGWNFSKERELASVFEQNKGRLPVPITGSYMIGSRFGIYNVQGLKNVQLDNKGTNFIGRSGAMARSIFDGEISAVFQYSGSYNVLVRHGSYISVYCNLSSVRVKKGEKVKARDILGVVERDEAGNCVLHFQLRKETVKLNPEHWIGK